jgi:DNA-binding CsgD family transcriptional regulator
MKKTITVCILDVNRFFAQGIQHILELHLQHEGQGVRFVDEHEVARADLVFRSESKGWPLKLCHAGQQDKPVASVYIIIRTTSTERAGYCWREQGSLSRHSRPQMLLALIDEWLKLESKPLPPALCPCCMSLSLTEREVEVMRFMSWEMTPKSLPRYLNISQKTVSTHKRAVMRKLGFKRNTELYHWLRLGGLDQIKRTYL